VHGRQIGLCRRKVLVSEDVRIEGENTGASESRHKKSGGHGCCPHLHVLWNNAVTIDGSVFLHATVTLLRPPVLDLSEHQDIERLKLVHALGREGEDDYVGFKHELPELIRFVRVVAVDEEEDWVVIHLVGGGEGDESLLEPTQAESVVGPPIVRCGDRDVHRWVENREGSLGKDEGRGSRQARGGDALNDGNKLEVV
jgi:hypothetical protein